MDILSCPAVVEDLFKRREPMPSMDAIYFLQPLKEKYYSIAIDHLLSFYHSAAAKLIASTICVE
jgi:hypothetical protein